MEFSTGAPRSQNNCSVSQIWVALSNSTSSTPKYRYFVAISK